MDFLKNCGELKPAILIGFLFKEPPKWIFKGFRGSFKKSYKATNLEEFLNVI